MATVPDNVPLSLAHLSELDVPPLDPGSYPFACPVHPNMGGTITVEP